MQYRNFGKSDFKVSALSFGCMRLPCDENGRVKDDESIKMIRYAIDNGVNYLDSAYVYHEGYSEVVTGKALKNGYRNKVKIATKLPMWSVETSGDFDKFLDEQLKRFETDVIDYYLFHALGNESWEKVLKLDLIDKAEKVLKAGKINHIGFSFHDHADAFKKIIDGYDKWDFCQVQYNYMDIENQAGSEGVRYASGKGIPVIVMEPLLGGRLANPPANISKIWSDYDKNKSAVYWALKWLWSQKEVTTVLSGMSDMEQLEENLKAADDAMENSMKPDELNLIEEIRSMYIAQFPISCTKCNYCMPCPSGVNIPGNMEFYNNGISHDDMPGAQFSYRKFFPDEMKANQCTQCKLCEEKCPQKIEISDWMIKIHKALG